MTKPLRYIFGIVGMLILAAAVFGLGMLLARGIAWLLGWC